MAKRKPAKPAKASKPTKKTAKPVKASRKPTKPKAAAPQAKRKAAKTAKPSKAAAKAPAKKGAVRAGGTSAVSVGVARVENSGLEVWLYDEGNRAELKNSGALNFLEKGKRSYEDVTSAGLVVGYSLESDNPIYAEVFVGGALSEKQLSVARWLKPQTAFLKLPTGKLCIESNDASRIGPEDPLEKGAVFTVAPGDYRVTLHRIDAEALERDDLNWEGPNEWIVLTPGGKKSDAVDELLPFEANRDLSWVGKYFIKDNRADGLAWFMDTWETLTLNLDSEAVKKFGLKPGSYVNISVPSVGVSLVAAYSNSWTEGQRLPEPTGTSGDYGYGSLTKFDDWNRAEAMLFKRERTKTKIPDQQLHQWHAAVIEKLDAQPLKTRAYSAAKLAEKKYFKDDFLSMVLGEVLPEAAEEDELPLARALEILNTELGKLGLRALGDFSWEDKIYGQPQEVTARIYAGLPHVFAAIMTSAGIFEILFLSERGDQTWLATGLADDFEGRCSRKDHMGIPRPNPKVALNSSDEALGSLFEAHTQAVEKSKTAVLESPQDFLATAKAFERFIHAALD